MRMKRVKRTILLILTCTIPACLQASTNLDESQTVDIKLRQAPSLEVFQANVKGFQWTFKNNTVVLNGSGYSPLMYWATDNQVSAIVPASCSWINQTLGVFRASFSASDLNTNGLFIYGVGVQSGGVTIARQGSFLITPDPFSTADPITYVTNVNWGLYSFSGTTNGPLVMGSNINFRSVGTRGQFAIDALMTGVVDWATFRILTNDVTNAWVKLNVVSNRVVDAEAAIACNSNLLAGVSGRVVNAEAGIVSNVSAVANVSNEAYNILSPKLDVTSNSAVSARTVADYGSNYAVNIIWPKLNIASQNVDTVSSLVANAVLKYDIASQNIDTVSGLLANAIIKYNVVSQNVNTVSGMLDNAITKYNAVSNYWYTFGITNNASFTGMNIYVSGIVNMQGNNITNINTLSASNVVLRDGTTLSNSSDIGSTDILTNNFTGTAVTFYATSITATNTSGSTSDFVIVKQGGTNLMGAINTHTGLQNLAHGGISNNVTTWADSKFYPSNNPNSYITSNGITTWADSKFYPSNNPAAFTNQTVTNIISTALHDHTGKIGVAVHSLGSASTNKSTDFLMLQGGTMLGAFNMGAYNIIVTNSIYVTNVYMNTLYVETGIVQNAYFTNAYGNGMNIQTVTVSAVVGSNSVWGSGLSMTNFVADSHGSVQRGQVGASVNFTINSSDGAEQAITAGGSGSRAMIINGDGAKQLGRLPNNVGVTNNGGIGSIQLFSLSVGQDALMTGSGSISLGANTNTHDRSITIGDGAVSYAKDSLSIGTGGVFSAGPITIVSSDPAAKFVGNGSGITNYQATNLIYVLTNRTVSITTNQATIEAENKYIHPGTTLTFQLADGTNQMLCALQWQGFGPGHLVVQGNVSEANATVLHTNQTVTMNATNLNNYAFIFQGNFCESITLRNITLWIPFNTSYNGVKFADNSAHCDLSYCWIRAYDSIGHSGVYYWGARGKVLNTYFTAGTHAINAGNLAYVLSSGSTNVWTQQSYGLGCYGGIILKDGGQPSGSVANEYKANGGQIF